MGGQAPQEVPGCILSLEAKEHMSSEVRLRALSQYSGLNVLEIQVGMLAFEMIDEFLDQ